MIFCIGPKLFTDYESLVGDIIRNHCIQAHLYADDTELYIAFKPELKEMVLLQLREAFEGNMSVDGTAFSKIQ